MIIVLLGYMASGKSLIGSQLAKKLDIDFIDLDNYIEDNEHASINDIFRTKGEIYFRKIEANYLKDILSKKKKAVLALGGGTPCYANNMETLLNNSNCKIFYLRAALTTLVKRLDSEKNKRPLIAHLETKDEMLEFVGKHLFERNSFYNQADYIVSTDDKEVDSIIEAIVFKLF